MLYGNGYSTVVDFSDGRNAEIDLLTLRIKCIDTGVRSAILIIDDAYINDDIRRLAEEFRIKLVGISEADFLVK